MDQASKLRSAVIKKGSTYEVSTQNDGDASLERARVICVTSGKGGVGKTNLTLNLALAIKTRGFKTLIIDADLGLANIEVLVGSAPKYNFMDVIEGGMGIRDIVMEGPLGIKIISGGAGISETANLPVYKLNKLLANLAILENDFDYIIIDTGAGISKSVISFAKAADEVIVITLPEPTAIADAYALIKTLRRESIEKIGVVVNKVDNILEAESTFKKLETVSKRFLGVGLGFIGHISADNNIIRAVKQQEPFYLKYESSPASRNVEQICSRLTGKEKTKSSEGFVQRLASFFISSRR
ncbi:cobyrinic acid ac-diamide synthase [Peptoclostridium acidaminophilum DSM 3953]|uniref:Cobyrinic acid ac-diamide synthase n=1 Tax=Peptoclostridium acidaminophilum DSM 3953 TaxID=1286171 RepID=W8U6Y8_PEPAC|nr:MinD/ParA family protein [Peptoclostridium acidaminophilum]AHM56641.1 cobyrinic acid ac-diamide synthase [Peptoclostridium acidaminophilum DSM 3953]